MPDARWNNVLAEHVLEALRRYDQDPRAPRARSTFLLCDGKSYPAKHIRGLAFEIANGQAISKQLYSGGEETARFLRNLGFAVEHAPSSRGSQAGRAQRNTRSPRTWAGAGMPRRLDEVKQKNALQLLLQQRFGTIITEVKFEWLRTPGAELPSEYVPIVRALREHSPKSDFYTKNLTLLCDFAVVDQRLIIEYDERQHFTAARAAALGRYADEIQLGFSRETWIAACRRIDAHDNSPPHRDAGRAMYDTVRDIEAQRHGYRLIRIKHGDVDWEAEDAAAHLEQLVLGAAISNVTERRVTASTGTAGLRVAPSTPSLDFRSMEVLFQRIRISYLKWLFHFKPPSHKEFPLDTVNKNGDQGDFRVLLSRQGRSFTLSPCGQGSIYTGGGMGSIKLPSHCYQGPTELERETKEIKKGLTRSVRLLRRAVTAAAQTGDRARAWRLLLDYYWLKYGLHEYAFDVTFQLDAEGEPLPVEKLRDRFTIAMQRGVDLGQRLDRVSADRRFSRFVSHKTTWTKYAICAMDCGPIAWGADGYVPFLDIIKARRAFEREPTNRAILDGSRRGRIKFARMSLESLVHFVIDYENKIAGRVDLFSDFDGSRDYVRGLIRAAQDQLNDVVGSEQLDLPTYSYVP